MFAGVEAAAVLDVRLDLMRSGTFCLCWAALWLWRAARDEAVSRGLQIDLTAECSAARLTSIQTKPHCFDDLLWWSVCWITSVRGAFRGRCAPARHQLLLYRKIDWYRERGRV